MGEFWSGTPISMLPDAVVLYEGDECDVIGSGSSVELSLKGRWNASCARLARKFGVRYLKASEIQGWPGDSLEFLDQLPGLCWILICTSQSLDWKPLERLAELESMMVFPRSQNHHEIDFTRLWALRNCSIDWLPQFDSVRHCRWLTSLQILDLNFSNLRELDLRELGDLEELRVDSCGELRKIDLAQKARIRALEISHCPKLQVDLKRFVRDLELLSLQGKQAYPLDDLAQAKHLKELALFFVKTKEPIPPFMGKLPCLIDALVVKTRVSKPDQKIVDAFDGQRRKEMEAQEDK